MIFLKKYLPKLGVGENFLNLNKGHIKANMTLNGKRLNAFSL